MFVTLLLTLSCFVSWTHQAPLGGGGYKLGQKSSLTCDACKGVVAVIQILLDGGAVREDIEKFAVYFCERLNIEDRNVCSSIVPLFSVSLRTLLLPLICTSYTYRRRRSCDFINGPDPYVDTLGVV